MTKADVFRVYEPVECGEDGYPFAWYVLADDETGRVSLRRGLKDVVREQAGNRCVRCGHPYRRGEHPMESLLNEETGEIERTSWSPCDENCSHPGPVRVVVRGELVGHYEAYNGGADCAHAGWDEIPGATIEAAWRILTVHHLNGDKADCRWWNLASLCQRCHLRIQRTVVMPRVFPWEHTEWFKPYAAGWYAFAYLGLELSRDEVGERLEELLMLERVA